MRYQFSWRNKGLLSQNVTLNEEAEVYDRMVDGEVTRFKSSVTNGSLFVDHKLK